MIGGDLVAHLMNEGTLVQPSGTIAGATNLNFTGTRRGVHFHAKVMAHEKGWEEGNFVGRNGLAEEEKGQKVGQDENVGPPTRFFRCPACALTGSHVVPRS